MALARHTLVIAVVCAALGLIILLVIFYRTLSPYRRSRASPLPPIQPLSHEREFQRAQFEASRSRNLSFLAAPPHSALGYLSPGSSKTSLLGTSKSPRTSYITTTAESSEELSNSSPLESVPSIPVSRMPTSSSSLNLSQSPSPLRHSSRVNPDDQHRRRPTPSTLSRGVPHARHSVVQIVLPAPLGANMPPHSGRQSMYELDAARDRMSIVDQWVPAGRNSNGRAPSRRPRRAASNPNTKSMTNGCQADHESMPPPPFITTVPVPVPSPPPPHLKHYEGEEDETRAGGRGRRLTKRTLDQVA